MDVRWSIESVAVMVWLGILVFHRPFGIVLQALLAPPS